MVFYRSLEPPGTVIIDTPNTYLYYVLGGGQAMAAQVRAGPAVASVPAVLTCVAAAGASD